MNLISKAKDEQYVFLSVIGSHAGEDIQNILSRKSEDIKKSGKSYWVANIHRNFIEAAREKLNGKNGYLLLLESSSNGSAAKDTKIADVATEVSNDKENWMPIDKSISDVTGNLGNGTTAYCFDDIQICDENIDLEFYSDTEEDSKIGVKFSLAKSNIFSRKYTTKRVDGMKNTVRKVIAVLRLKSPYVVWVK